MKDWHDVSGFFMDYHQAEYQRLLELVPEPKAPQNRRIMAEVGAFRGRSLCSVAPTIRSGGFYVLSVDLFDQVTYPYNEEDVLKTKDGMLKDFVANLYDFNLVQNVEIMEMASLTAASRLIRRIGKPFLDIVFIDAAHDYESVKADIQAWRQLVKLGGILCGHDYGDLWPGVVNAVQDSFEKNLIHIQSEIWSVRL